MTTRRLQCRMAVVLGCVLAAGAARAADVESVLARMRQAVEPATTMRAAFDFAVTNRTGESVHWVGNLYRRAGPPTLMRLAFESPADMKGTVVDVTRGKAQVTHTRIYLPSVRRVRDVEADARGESFLWHLDDDHAARRALRYPPPGLVLRDAMITGACRGAGRRACERPPRWGARPPERRR